MNTLSVRTLLTIVVPTYFALASTIGCYDPHPAEGTLACSVQNECPEGYTCRTPPHACFSTGAGTTSGTGGAPGTGGAGGGGSGVISSDPSLYVGIWAFGPKASVENTCDNGTSGTNSLADDPNGVRSLMTITRPASAALGALRSVWLCDFYLTLDSNGAHLGTGSHSCADTTADPKSTWTATSFELTTLEGVNLKHTADYNRVDVYANGTTVTCRQKVTATLKKQ